MTPEQALSALLVTRRDALVNKHSEALQTLLHPNYVYVNSIGTVLGRDQYVEYYCGTEVTIKEMEMLEVFYAPIGDTGFLILHTRETFEYQGKTYVQEYRVQHVVLQQEGKWLFASGQSTPIM